MALFSAIDLIQAYDEIQFAAEDVKKPSITHLISCRSSTYAFQALQCHSYIPEV